MSKKPKLKQVLSGIHLALCIIPIFLLCFSALLIFLLTQESTITQTPTLLAIGRLTMELMGIAIIVYGLLYFYKEVLKGGKDDK